VSQTNKKGEKEEQLKNRTQSPINGKRCHRRIKKEKKKKTSEENKGRRAQHSHESRTIVLWPNALHFC